MTGTNYCIDPFTAGPPVSNDSINFNGTPNAATTNTTTNSFATILATEVPVVATTTTVPVTITTSAACFGGSQTSTASLFTINPPLTVSPTSLPGGAVGSPYNQTITAAGGTPGYGQPTLVTGSLPFGSGSTAGTQTFNFNPGGPTTYNFQLNFTDSGGGSISPSYSIRILQPNTVTASQGTPQSQAVGMAFSTLMQVLVMGTDANGAPFPVQGAQVTFTAPVGGGPSGTFAGSNVVFTDATGHATAPAFTANTTVGSYQVGASVPTGSDSPAITTVFNLTNTAGAPATITTTSGSPQSTVVNTAFGNTLQTTVRDRFGIVVPAVHVVFAGPGSGAGVTFTGSATQATNSSGVATATVSANTKAGAYTVNATTAGVATPAAFSLTNNPGGPVSITPNAGSPQTAAVGTVFPVNLQAKVADAFGNGIQGVLVTFAAPASNLTIATGTFGRGPATNATTDINGLATASAFTANTVEGSYIVTGSTGALDAQQAQFQLTNGAGPPATITSTAGTPQSTVIKTAFPTALQAVVKDANGNLAPNVAVTFAAPVSGASGTFTGSATVNTNASGVATAPGFTANLTAGSYSVTASVSGVATPAAYSLTNNIGAPASISAVGGNSQTVLTGATFPLPLSAIVRDIGGNPVPNVQVTFSLPGAGASGTFQVVGTPLTAVATTNASGIAVSPSVGANSIAGAFAATASTAGVAVSANFILSSSPGVSISTSSLGTAIVGQSDSVQIVATGGTGSYNFTIGSGSLPAGMSMSSSGLVFGTPQISGTFVIFVQVFDGGGSSASRSLTLVVTNPLTITTSSSLPNATVGIGYSVSFQATGGAPPVIRGVY